MFIKICYTVLKLARRWNMSEKFNSISKSSLAQKKLAHPAILI